jgi:hypothetical protein
VARAVVCLDCFTAFARPTAGNVIKRKIKVIELEIIELVEIRFLTDPKPLSAVGLAKAIA